MKIAELLNVIIPALLDDLEDCDNLELSLIALDDNDKEIASSIARIRHDDSLGYHVTSTEVYH